MSATSKDFARRSPEEVFAHHGQTLGAGDIDGIMADFTETSVLLTPDETYRGLVAIRRFFAALVDALPNAQWGVTQRWSGNVLLLEWTCDSDLHVVRDGIDTFVFRDGTIEVQTARCSLIKKHLT